MKKVVLVFLGLYFSNPISTYSQEKEIYLEVILASLSEKYLKSESELYFTIQIASTENQNFYLEKINNIHIIKDEDYLFKYKYRLGFFPTYKEANEFKQIISSVYNDAFIVAVKKGKRIDVQEALEQIKQ